ncbi:BT1926 family outer membrane beta-barrel protein [Labilibaculum manganireducens]|uniref:BT1926 family outer membrane beta-barrel protein n=1 Tax=Labilibaculum manganireducens TaxID=1940525 RepID=UPI0029F54A1A|nr:BT1926 family outer membrane beta-barrel protein [Labilibaculum manganireducens]
MCRKIISLISLSLLLCTAVYSQGKMELLPKKGNFTVALVLGDNDVTDIDPAVLPNYSVYDNFNNYYVSRLGADDNFSVKQPASITNMAGVSLNYFLSDKISLNLFGSYGYKSTPGEEAYSGVLPMSDSKGNVIEGSEIPAIQGSPETTNHKLYLSAGADYHFKFDQDVKALRNTDFYLGGRFNFMYERLEKNQISWLKDDKGDYSVNSEGGGVATAEAIGFGGALVGGVDYYFTQSLFIGLEVNVFNFMYQHTEIVKMPGVQGADQKTTFMNAMSYPRLKIGFKIF